MIPAADFPPTLAKLSPCCSTIARRLPALTKNKLALPPPLALKNQIALLAPCDKKSMSTGTNTSFAVLAGAPSTLRRSRSMIAASNRSRLVGGAWLSLTCAPFHSARASICARLASAASRWSSCNSHTISYARLCISTQSRRQK